MVYIHLYPILFQEYLFNFPFNAIFLAIFSYFFWRLLLGAKAWCGADESIAHRTDLLQLVVPGPMTWHDVAHGPHGPKREYLQ